MQTQNLDFQLVVLDLCGVLSLPERASLFLARLAFGRVFGLADILGNFVSLPVQFLNIR